MIGIETPGIDVRLRRELAALMLDATPQRDSRIRAFIECVGVYLGALERVAAHAPRVLPPELALSTRIELRYRLELLRESGRLAAETARVMDEVIECLPTRLDQHRDLWFHLNAWFPHGEAWSRDLDALAGREGLRFLELGSWEGRSACWLLENILTHETSRITCADYFGANEVIFDHNIATIGALPRVVKRRGPIRETVRTLPHDHYDFIYVDASSSVPAQLADCVDSWHLLKPGGLVTFDDYGGPLDWEPGVRNAIDAFLSAMSGHYELIRSGFQVTLRKEHRGDAIP